uniref:Uncharacterized protein n=1 Tax=Knipowitschia caucasica TaxID=637954 RepID=A0AAV2L8D6_KNICA
MLDPHCPLARLPFCVCEQRRRCRKNLSPTTDSGGWGAADDIEELSEVTEFRVGPSGAIRNCTLIGCTYACDSAPCTDGAHCCGMVLLRLLIGPKSRCTRSPLHPPHPYAQFSLLLYLAFSCPHSLCLPADLKPN